MTKKLHLTVHGSKTILIFKIAFLLLADFFINLGLFILKQNLEISDVSNLNFLNYVGLVANIITIFIILAAITMWISRYYIIDDAGITAYKGVLFKKIKTVDFKGIRSVIVTESLIGKLFKYGSITLDSPVVKRNMKMINIANPKKFANIIEKKRIELIEGEKATFIPI